VLASGPPAVASGPLSPNFPLLRSTSNCATVYSRLLKQGTTQAMGLNCRKFQTLLASIVMSGIIFNIITSH